MAGRSRSLFAARILLASGAVASALSVLALFDAAPTPAGAVASQTVALYNMNESSTATKLVDSGARKLDGAIGPNVITGVAVGADIVHRFSATASDGSIRTPTGLPVEPERLDTVPHSSSMNPDSEDFAVSVRYRTDKPFGNLVQKGQNQSLGGYFKIELPGGRPTCLFKGLDAGGNIVQRAVEPPQPVPGVPDPYDLRGTTFHTIKCERLVNRVALWIDGVEVNRLVGPSGTIVNTKNLSIAGKSNCDQVETTCDYFIGDIDWVRIEKAPDPNKLPNAAFTSKCNAAGVCTFDATGSKDPDGTISSYEWDFGDLGTATGSKPSHTFAPGEFLVALVITDNDGGQSSVEKTISVAAPPTTTTTTTTTIVAQEPPPGRVTEVKGAATGLKPATRLPVVTGE